MPMKLTPDFKQSLDSVVQQSKNYASTYDTLGYSTLHVLHNIPFYMVNYIYNNSSKNTTFGFSSVPGPPDGFCFHGMKSKGMWGFYPSQCEQLCNTLVSFMDRSVRVAVQLDTNYVENPREFVQYFDKRIKEFMNINQK